MNIQGGVDLRMEWNLFQHLQGLIEIGQCFAVRVESLGIMSGFQVILDGAFPVPTEMKMLGHVGCASLARGRAVVVEPSQEPVVFTFELRHHLLVEHLASHRGIETVGIPFEIDQLLMPE